MLELKQNYDLNDLSHLLAAGTNISSWPGDAYNVKSLIYDVPNPKT